MSAPRYLTIMVSKGNAAAQTVFMAVSNTMAIFAVMANYGYLIQVYLPTAITALLVRFVYLVSG